MPLMRVKLLQHRKNRAVIRILWGTHVGGFIMNVRLRSETDITAFVRDVRSSVGQKLKSRDIQ